MDEEPNKQPAKGYGKRSLKFWVITYVIAAAVIYALVYLLFIHKSGSGSVGY